MNILNDLVQELISVIGNFREDKIKGEALEKITSKIMVNDCYEKTPQEFQDNIELLDTWEIQQLSNDDLEKIQKYFKLWSGQGKN